MTDPGAWPQIVGLVEVAPDALVLSADVDRRAACLGALAVTKSSFLGAMAAECGAILIDHGWLRLLGAGAQGLPGLDQAVVITPGVPPPLLLVAFDALGGRFAINGGGLPGEPGGVQYWGPDTLSWTELGLGHSAFVRWALSPGPTEFYADLRWPGWEAEVAALTPDQGIASYPPPWSREGKDLATASRAPVPLAELIAHNEDVARQLEG